MRRRMNGPRFHHVLVTDDLNAAVLQRPAFGLVGPSRNHLILGVPLLDSLAQQEALAVVAHEYGHLGGSHSRFAALIYRLRAGWGTVQGMSQQWQGAAGRALQRRVGWYAPYFNAYSFVLARANEYRADAAAAEQVGADVAASALKRTNLTTAHYSRYVQHTFHQAATRPAPPPDFAARWAEVAHQAESDQAHGWLRNALAAEGGLGDMHPPLRERFERAIGAAQVARRPEVVTYVLGLQLCKALHRLTALHAERHSCSRMTDAAWSLLQRIPT